MAATGRKHGVRNVSHPRGRGIRTSRFVGVALAVGLAASACSSGSSVDESALPTPTAREIGLAVNADITGTKPDLTTFDDTNGHAGIPAGGKYQIGVRNPQSLVTATLDDSFPVDQIVTASFDASGGAIDAGFGIICRMVDEDNYYRLGVGNDGTYAIQKVKGGKLTVLTGAGQWVRAPSIRNTPGVFNVRVDCVGDTLTLFESNQPIAQVRDDTIKGHTVGVFVESFREPSATIQVDSLSVRAFTDRSRVTDIVADGWEDVLRTQSVSNRCTLLDPKRANVGAKTLVRHPLRRCAAGAGRARATGEPDVRPHRQGGGRLTRSRQGSAELSHEDRHPGPPPAGDSTGRDDRRAHEHRSCRMPGPRRLDRSHLGPRPRRCRRHHAREGRRPRRVEGLRARLAAVLLRREARLIQVPNANEA